MASLHPRDLATRIATGPGVIQILAPVLLGALAGLGHESFRHGVWIPLVAFAVAFMLVPTRRTSAAWFGWFLGVGYFALTLRWLIEPFLVDPVRHGWMAPFAILLMAGGLALFWGAAFWVARWLAASGLAILMWLPVTLALGELARGHVLSGFPWGMVSYTLIGSNADALFAWIGPYGVSWAVFALAASAAYLVQRKWLLLVPWVGLVLVGAWTVSAYTPAAPIGDDSVVRIVQPNAPQEQKWDPAWRDVFFDRALVQTRAAPDLDRKPIAVIWPETSVPALLEYAQPWISQMAQAANGAVVVAGVQRREERQFYNSAVLIDPDGTVRDTVDKAQLVPFGEYVPLAWVFEPLGLGTLVEQISGFTPGSGDGVMQVDGLGLVRVLICYEGIFPEDMYGAGGVRPDQLLIITNDAWFGNGPGPRQHLTQARARAIEQGLPVIRAANTGISASIDARGRVMRDLALNEAGYLDVRVQAPLPPTLYALFGDWPIAILLALSVAVGIAFRPRLSVDPPGVRG